jgi:UDP-N-acetylglucosamine transferase subunit ALG13
VILAVLSTHPQPFPRAVRLASQLAQLRGEELHVQHGRTEPVPGIEARWQAWYTRAELGEAMRAASVVLVHGGSGCIFHALRVGARPFAIPRLARYGEHVDDHQLQLCGKLEAVGTIVCWMDGERAEAVQARLSRPSLGRLPERPDLRAAVWGAARARAGR